VRYVGNLGNRNRVEFGTEHRGRSRRRAFEYGGNAMAAEARQQAVRLHRREKSGDFRGRIAFFAAVFRHAVQPMAPGNQLIDVHGGNHGGIRRTFRTGRNS
jgi:hypothetical protein